MPYFPAVNTTQLSAKHFLRATCSSQSIVTVSYNSFTPVPPNLRSGIQEFFSFSMNNDIINLPEHLAWWTFTNISLRNFDSGITGWKDKSMFSFDGYCKIFIQGEWNYIFALKYPNLLIKGGGGERRNKKGSMFVDTENRLVLLPYGLERDEAGVHRCKLLYMDRINKVLPCITERTIFNTLW